MSLGDPLADLPPPACDVSEAQRAGERYRQLGRNLQVSAQTLRSKVAQGTAADVWVGDASTSAADAGGRLAAAYEVTAEAAAAAGAALLGCAAAWAEGLATYARARTLADEAVRAEAAHSVMPIGAVALSGGSTADSPWVFSGLGPGAWISPERAQARALARTALGDVEAASQACATALDRTAAVLTPQAQPAPAHHKHWWDRGPVGSVVHGTERVLGTAGDVLKEIATHPDQLINDAAGMGLGVGLMLLGGAEEAGGLALDATVVGAPVGLAVNGVGALTIAGGAVTATGFAIKTGHDLSDTILQARARGPLSSDPTRPADPGTTEVDLEMGRLTQGGKATSSELKAFAEAQGWVRVEGGGPAKYVDENGVRRMVIKREASPRTPGSNFPRVELRNAGDQLIDPEGRPVDKADPANHTRITVDDK